MSVCIGDFPGDSKKRLRFRMWRYVKESKGDVNTVEWVGFGRYRGWGGVRLGTCGNFGLTTLFIA